MSEAESQAPDLRAFDGAVSTVDASKQSNEVMLLRSQPVKNSRKSTRSGRERLSALLPDRGVLRTYAAVVLADSVGTGMFLAGSVVFFTHYVGLTATQVGFGLSVAALVGLACAVPAGHAGDRFGHRPILLLCNALLALSVSSFLLVHNFTDFIAAVVAMGILESCARPVRRAMLADFASGAARVRASAYNRSLSNVGFSLGALAAGAALAADTGIGYAALVLGDAASFILVVLLLLRLPATRRRPKVVTGVLTLAGRRRALSDGRFLSMALGCAVLNLNASILDVALPLWVLTQTAAPRYWVAILLLVNTVLAIGLTVPASRGTDDVRGAGRAGRRGGLALGCSCALLAAAALPDTAGPAAALLVAGVLALTAGEILTSAGAWGISYGMAPDGREGEYLGVFTMVTQISQVAGPLLMAWIVAFGPAALLGLGLALATCGVTTAALSGRLRTTAISGRRGAYAGSHRAEA